MNPKLAFYQTSIGKKWIVALTAIPLLAYVIGHMLGNLQIFYSPEQINNYAHFLHSHMVWLWIIRCFLIFCFVVHIVTALGLAVRNRLARPERYAVFKTQATTYAARTMWVSGIVLLCFVIFHLLQFTSMTINSDYKSLVDANGHHDVYRMIVIAFHQPWAIAVYFIGMIVLCAHLYHGFSSFLQTLGINSVKVHCHLVVIGRILAILIFLGYISIPVSVMLGILK